MQCFNAFFPFFFSSFLFLFVLLFYVSGWINATTLYLYDAVLDVAQYHLSIRPTIRWTMTIIGLEMVWIGLAWSELDWVGLECLQHYHQASNKALFNSLYHWLLMEDYTFNGQTGINDADDDMKNKMNSDSKTETGTGTGTRARNTNDDDDVAAAAGDMENIENFLEKLNININTELILTKRRVRSITLTTPVAEAEATTTTTTIATESTTTATVPVAVADSDTTSKSKSQSIVMPSVVENNDATPSSTPAAGVDYETLEKMDYYYLLYDVW